MSVTYPPPVDQLLALGKPDARSEWHDYRALGLAEEHVPTLLALIEDPRLNWDLWDEGVDETPFWAPVHGWRALGQLGGERAAGPLVQALAREEDNDWAFSDIPTALAMIGPAALGPVRDALPAAARREDPVPASNLGDALVKIARAHPEVRDLAVETLTRQLRVWPTQTEEVNAFLVWDLMELKAVEAAPAIREAFEADAVDESVVGDWEDVQVGLGLLPKRTTPRPHYHLGFSLPVHRPSPPVPGSTSAAARSRQLRKAQKSAKKKHRR